MARELVDLSTLDLERDVLPEDELRTMLQAAGFADIRIAPKDESRAFIQDWAPGLGIEDYVISATIEAIRP